MYKTYLCSYNYQNSKWIIELKATSFEDAANRLKALGYNGKVDGEVYIEIPIFTREIRLNKIKYFLKNLSKSLCGKEFKNFK